MSITSYAQNFEDVMLWRALGHVEKGRYIDIGAQDPMIDSVSLAFYEHGWRGIHVEPTPRYADLLRESRPEDTVIQAAVGSKNGVLTFFEFPETGLSTSDLHIAERQRGAGFQMREIAVPCITLADVFSQCAKGDVHWLKIDVEGYERHVLKGWQTASTRPWIVVVESTLPLTKIESHRKWERLVLDRGYRFAYFDGLNRFYVSEAHLELLDKFRVGPNYFDGFTLNRTVPFCSSLNAKIHVLDEQLHAERQQAARAEGGLTQTRERIGALDRALSDARSEGEALRQQLAAAQQQTEHAVADRLDRELKALYASRSWRITAPLRRVNAALHAAGQLPHTAKERSKRGLKLLLAHGVVYVKARPRLKQAVLAALAPFPALKARLFRVAEVNSPPMPIPATPMQVPASADQLSPRARQVYQDLMQAKAQSASGQKKQ